MRFPPHSSPFSPEKGVYKKAGKGHFIRAWSDSTRRNDLLREGRVS